MTDYEIAKYYAEKLAEFGPTWKAGDYGSAESQRTRFDVLRECLLTTDAGLLIGTPSVLDVGCGVGDLLGHLPTSLPYTGWDFSEPVIEAAIAKWGERAAPYTFETRSLMESTEEDFADYVFASGLFQFRGLAYIKRAVTRMYELAKVTVAFNVLTSETLVEEIENDPFTIGRFCRTLTPRVVVRCDYKANDATIILFKD